MKIQWSVVILFGAAIALVGFAFHRTGLNHQPPGVPSTETLLKNRQSSPNCIAGPPSNADLGPAPAGSFDEIACLEIVNDTEVERVGEIAFSGIPIARSLNLMTTDFLVVAGPNERRLPAQFDVLARWDGSPDDASLPIQWLQVAVQAFTPANVRVGYALRRYAANTPPPDALAATIVSNGSSYLVGTGVANFRLDPQNPALIAGIDVDLGNGGSMTSIYAHTPGAGPRLVINSGGPLLVLDSATPNRVQVDAGRFQIVETGPVKVVVLQKGHFTDPAGSTLCNPIQGVTYERFGFTLALTFTRGSRDIDIQFHFRNECGDAWSGPWTDEAVTVDEVSWNFPLALGPTTVQYAGGGAIAPSGANAFGTTLVEQRKGGGSPWARRARVTVDGSSVESSEFFDSPYLALGDAEITAAAQMPWMRYREPQGIRAIGSTLSFLFVSEPLVVGESRGIWNFGRLSFLPAPMAVELETRRQQTRTALERGLLVRTPLSHINQTRVFPSLGNDSSSLLKTNYVNMLTTLHEDTVKPAGQWDRAKTYGSQLWPDTQYDPWAMDNETPYENSVAMNYWNPSGAELLEFFRSGEPKWAWDMALQASWLQMFSAYYNIGDQNHGNCNGFAVTSGGTGEGQWHRSAWGSSDYSYNLGMQVAYLIRPNAVLRDRFRQAGRMVALRYNIPKENETDREQWVSQVDITRQVIQHFEMLSNGAQFVPGPDGRAFLDRLRDLVEELSLDNLKSGLMAQGDIPSTASFFTPQQFMQNAMMYAFFMRYYRNYGDVAGILARALVDIGVNYYNYGIEKGTDGRSILVSGNFVSVFRCTLNSDGDIVNCVPAPDSDGNLYMWNSNKPHTLSILMMAHELDPTIQLCDVVRAAYDDPQMYEFWWNGFFSPGAGYWKGVNQMMQGMIFSVGIYDTCSSYRAFLPLITRP